MGEASGSCSGVWVRYYVCAQQSERIAKQMQAHQSAPQRTIRHEHKSYDIMTFTRYAGQVVKVKRWKKKILYISALAFDAIRRSDAHRLNGL